MPVREEGVQCHVEGPGCVDKQVNKEVSATTKQEGASYFKISV